MEYILPRPGNPENEENQSSAMGESKDERKARLAQALRDNLRRRKAQARAGGGDTPAAASSPAPAPPSPPAGDTPGDGG